MWNFHLLLFDIMGKRHLWHRLGSHFLWASKIPAVPLFGVLGGLYTLEHHFLVRSGWERGKVFFYKWWKEGWKKGENETVRYIDLQESEWEAEDLEYPLTLCTPILAPHAQHATWEGPQGEVSKYGQIQYCITWRKERKVTTWTNHSDLRGSTFLKTRFLFQSC